LKSLYKYIVFCLILCANHLVFAQEGYGTELSADSGSPYTLSKDGDYILKFPGNKGEEDYLKEHFRKNEINSYWMKYKPVYNGLLEFEVHVKEGTRVDFYLFKRVKNQSKTTLDFILKGSTSGSGNTGINLIKSSLENYEEPVEVAPGTDYYILLNCFDLKKLKFDFHISTNIDFAGLIKYNKIVDLTSSRERSVINVKMRDSETGGLVETMVQIDGLKLDQNVYMGTDYMFHPNGNSKIEIECTAMGYFFQTKFIDPKEGGDREVVIPMERLKIGKKLELENIKFSRGTDDFIEVAFNTLIKLQKFMAENVDARIEIQGHVNGPKMDNTRDLIELSEKRARAVMNYLVKNGISKERIAFRGMGNSEMIHKNPIFEEQAEENRRVEIMIIE
jgi:outer membrane protein OmpA-like peptidoglycan-associated protein